MQSATAQQRLDAQSVVDAFDWSQAAQDAWELAQEPLLQDLKQQAQTGRDQIDAENASIDTFLAIPNPNNAQNAAAIRQLATAHRASNVRQRRMIDALVRVIVRTWRNG